MELTENMEEFLNDLIGKRMEQVYQEKYGEQYDPFNEELELKVQKVIRKLPQKQGKVIFDYMTETSNNNSVSSAALPCSGCSEIFLIEKITFCSDVSMVT